MIMSQRDIAKVITLPEGLTIEVWPSDGDDGCIVVQIDTTPEHDGKLRVNVNDGHVFGPEYHCSEPGSEHDRWLKGWSGDR